MLVEVEAEASEFNMMSSIFELSDARIDSVEAKEANCCSSVSSNASSIGKNSDLSGKESSEGDAYDESEVQSGYHGAIDSMDALEEALPIKRGISRFYNGKSKSFTSLAEASSFSSSKDFAKPENAYVRRRRNLVAFNHVWDKNKCLLLHQSNGSGISKRSICSSRSTLALAFAMSSSSSGGGGGSDHASSTSEDSNPSSNSRLVLLLPSIRPSQGNLQFLQRPDLDPNSSSSRSLSLADLHPHVADSPSSSSSSSS